MLKTLVHSKHKSISTSSASALRNLMAVKPGSSSTDNESHASFSFRRSNTLPGKGRAQSSQNGNVRSDRKYRSFFSRKQPVKEVPNTSTTATESTLLLKKVTNKTFQNSAEDSRKVHRKVKHGEPHYYADLYQDPPRRGITMPQTKDPTIVLYSSENVQSALEGPQEELPLPFSGSRVERWNKLQNGNQCSCKHGILPNTEQLNIDPLQQGVRGMAIEEESPFIARQRPGSSSSSLSSCSPPAQVCVQTRPGSHIMPIKLQVVIESLQSLPTISCTVLFTPCNHQLIKVLVVTYYKPFTPKDGIHIFVNFLLHKAKQKWKSVVNMVSIV